MSFRRTESRIGSANQPSIADFCRMRRSADAEYRGSSSAGNRAGACIDGIIRPRLRRMPPDADFEYASSPSGDVMDSIGCQNRAILIRVRTLRLSTRAVFRCRAHRGRPDAERRRKHRSAGRETAGGAAGHPLGSHLRRRRFARWHAGGRANWRGPIDACALLHRIGRRGLASACIEGVQTSTAPYIAIMDADLQHDETLLPRMLETLQSRGDRRGGRQPLRRGRRHRRLGFAPRRNVALGDASRRSSSSRARWRIR